MNSYAFYSSISYSVAEALDADYVIDIEVRIEFHVTDLFEDTSFVPTRGRRTPSSPSPIDHAPLAADY